LKSAPDYEAPAHRQPHHEASAQGIIVKAAKERSLDDGE